MADCVDRDELLHAIGELPLAWEYGQAVSEIYEIVKNAPTINPDNLRPRGRWVDHMVRDWHCSECGKKLTGHGWDGYCYKNLPPYCPNCGAKMEGSDG